MATQRNTRSKAKTSGGNTIQRYANGAVQMTVTFEDPPRPVPRTAQRTSSRRQPDATPAPLDAGPEAALPYATPVLDDTQNPFLDDPANPIPPTIADATVQARLEHVATPVLDRPRAGPHSPSRARASHANSRSSTVPDGSDSESGGPSSTEDSGLRNKNRHAADDVWKFFARVGSTSRHECILCRRDIATGRMDSDSEPISYGKSTGTGVMRRHLLKTHHEMWFKMCNDLKIPITAKQARAPLAEWRQQQGLKAEEKNPHDIPPFSPEAFIDAICQLVIANDLSINLVESPFFRYLLRLLRQELRDCDIPHRTSVRKRIGELWEAHVKDLESELKKAPGRISFTMDIWTDTNLTSFMAVTAHWIEAIQHQTPEGPATTLNLRADLIGFHHIPGRHTGEHLAVAFTHVLDRLRITPKIGWITVDNASNNDTMMSTLSQSLSERNIPFSSTDSRVRCFPHVTNLACKSVLSAITNITLAAVDDNNMEIALEMVDEGPNRDVIALCRNLVRAIRSSSLRRDRFATLQQARYPNDKPLELLRDVDTRWSSTLLMIERFVKLKEFVLRMIADNPELTRYALRNSEWETLNHYVDILMVPHAFQQKLSSEKTPTLHQALPSFYRMIAAWEQLQSAKPHFHNVIDAGLRKLREYIMDIEDVPAYTLAMVINPKIKLTWYRKYNPDRLGWAKETFIEALRPYRASDAINTPAPPRRTNNSIVDDDDWADRVLGSPLMRDREFRSLDAEVNDDLLDTRSAATTLKFWQDNLDEYPTIYKLAMDLLPVQGSAVPCERVFSSAKETMTSRRSRILPHLMEALQMLKFSLRSEINLDFTAGTSKAAELEALEARSVAAVAVPDDITTYLQRIVEEPIFDSSSDAGGDDLGDEDDV